MVFQPFLHMLQLPGSKIILLDLKMSSSAVWITSTYHVANAMVLESLQVRILHPLEFLQSELNLFNHF